MFKNGIIGDLFYSIHFVSISIIAVYYFFNAGINPGYADQIPKSLIEMRPLSHDKSKDT